MAMTSYEILRLTFIREIVTTLYNRYRDEEVVEAWFALRRANFDNRSVNEVLDIWGNDYYWQTMVRGLVKVTVESP